MALILLIGVAHIARTHYDQSHVRDHTVNQTSQVGTVLRGAVIMPTSKEEKQLTFYTCDGSLGMSNTLHL